jgi:DNA-binding NarL/FixJ family response regulator
MVTFIIADNQELTRAGIESVIAGDDVRIFHAPDKAELIDLLKQHGDSVVILDYTLFDFTDVDNLLIVGERFCQSRWLLISDDLTAEFLKRIFYSSGQMGVVFKDQSLHIIREAINYTVSGNRYISQRAVVLLLNQQPEEPVTASSLTCTELEILKAIAQGKTTKEIAADRFSSIHTINTHRKNIFRKLGVNTAHEAVKYAFRAGLVDPSEFYI